MDDKNKSRYQGVTLTDPALIALLKRAAKVEERSLSAMLQRAARIGLDMLGLDPPADKPADTE